MGKVKKIHVLTSAGYSLLRVEDFSLSLDILHGGLEVRKIVIFYQKIG
jgi:hypothetical protein